MRKRLITSVVGLSMLTLTVTACGTVTSAAVGAWGGAAIDGLIGGGGGTLNGLNELHKNAQEYQDAYVRCMSARGYRG